MSNLETTLLAGESVISAPAIGETAQPGAPWHARWRQTPVGLVLACLFVLLLVVASLAPSLLVQGDPLDANARLAFQSPSAAHWLGTDENGRDVLVRLVHGARASLLMGLGATAIGVFAGISIGLAAGLGHSLLDSFLMRLVDVLLAFPDLLLALVIITFWGQGNVNAVVAVGAASIPRYARMVRARTLVVRGAPYVEAATSLGLHPLVVVWRHVLPNSIKPILLLATIGIGGKIAAGASLSFLGFGAPPPAPDWGSMLSIGRNYISNASWLVTAPAVAVSLTVLSVTALGRALIRNSEGKSV